MSDTKRPRSHLVFVEGAGFGALIASGIIGLYHPAWAAVAVLASILILLTFRRNSRAIFAGTKQEQQ